MSRPVRFPLFGHVAGIDVADVIVTVAKIHPDMDHCFVNPRDYFMAGWRRNGPVTDLSVVPEVSLLAFETPLGPSDIAGRKISVEPDPRVESGFGEFRP